MEISIEKSKNKEKSWSIQEFWNGSLILEKDRKTEPRDILYVGDIGAPFLDVYWKMLGIEPTNPFSDTIRRKMEAGNFIEAWIVWTFRKCGILKNWQGKVRLLDNPEYLPVYGRYDILAGHDGDWEKTKKEVYDFFNKIQDLGFDFPYYEIVRKKTLLLLEGLSQKYPNGLEDKIYEVKSLNSMAFWSKDEPISNPYEHHINQLTMYQLYNSDGLKNVLGSFLYVDRDTTFLSELPNIVKEEKVKELHDWLRKMTFYYRTKTEPPKPELIIFDTRRQQWTFNWQIDRSPYRDKILGDVKIEDLQKEIKNRNSNLKDKEKMRKAVANEQFHGIKKYQRAIQLLNKGKTSEEVLKLTGVPLIALIHYIEDLKVGKNENL